MMNPPLPVVLLIEDTEDDVFLMRRALRAGNVNVALQVVNDGQEAMDYIAGTERFADRALFPLPVLVLLDLKLPYIHGFQVLEALRSHPVLNQTPVFVLTSSPEERDRERAEALGAKSYHVKPPTPQLIEAVAKTLKEIPVAAK
jgi:CheY-like chemotaxis protein